MCTPVINTRNDELVVNCELPELPRDFKRVLRVQFKEFLHYLDDAVCEPCGDSRGAQKISA